LCQEFIGFHQDDLPSCLAFIGGVVAVILPGSLHGNGKEMMFAQRLLLGAAIWTAMFCSRSDAQPRPSDDKVLAAWVEKRVQAWQPTADERRIDQIAWAKDLRTAQRLAKENARPVFLLRKNCKALAASRWSDRLHRRPRPSRSRTRLGCISLRGIW
jgi:hypothetical protein